MSIGRVPVVPRGGNFESHILRSETVRRGDGWRTGYFGYNRGFRDSSFFFGFYAFDPFLEPCVISPWYYYSYLPGYISPGRVFYLSFAPVYYHWSSYYWQPPYFYDDGYADGYNAGYNSGSRNADDNNNGGVSTDQGVFVDNSKSGPRDPLLDAAINDLIRVYQRKDGGALDDILPANDRVNIYTDDHYDYSVNPADFSALVLDAAQQAHTVRFEITGVSIDGANAKVVALHTFEDASGKRQTVVQTYRFSRQDGRMVVVEFGTSQK